MTWTDAAHIAVVERRGRHHSNVLPTSFSQNSLSSWWRMTNISSAAKVVRHPNTFWCVCRTTERRVRRVARYAREQGAVSDRKQPTTVGNEHSEQLTALLSAMWSCLRKHGATLATAGMLRCTTHALLLNVVCSLRWFTGRLCEWHVNFLLIQHIFAESSPVIFTDSSNFADTTYFADSTNDWHTKCGIVYWVYRRH